MNLSHVTVTFMAALVLGVAVGAAGAADVAPLRVVTDHDPNFNTLWVDTVNREILVGNDAHETLQVYSATARGVVAPLREIKGPNTFVSFPGQVFIDPVNEEIWSVGNDIADMVTVYSRNAEGNAAPIRRIVFKPLGLNRTWGLAVDLVNNEVALTHQRRSRVTVWSRTTNTDVNPTATPLRTLSGLATQLADPAGVFIDPGSNEMYVVNTGHRVGSITSPSITVYARTAAGNAAPLPLDDLDVPPNDRAAWAERLKLAPAKAPRTNFEIVQRLAERGARVFVNRNAVRLYGLDEAEIHPIAVRVSARQMSELLDEADLCFTYGVHK